MEKIKKIFTNFPKLISYLFVSVWFFITPSYLNFIYDNCNIFQIIFQFFGISMLPLWLGLYLSNKKKHYINGVIIYGFLSIFMLMYFIIYQCSS